MPEWTDVRDDLIPSITTHCCLSLNRPTQYHRPLYEQAHFLIQANNEQAHSMSYAHSLSHAHSFFITYPLVITGPLYITDPLFITNHPFITDPLLTQAHYGNAYSISQAQYEQDHSLSLAHYEQAYYA